MISGEISLSCNVKATLPETASRPSSSVVTFPILEKVSYSLGDASDQISKAFYYSDSLVGAAFVLNLSTMVCIDGTVGMTHVRELIIINKGDSETEFLTLFGGANAFKPHLIGTDPTERLEAGSTFRLSKPKWPLGFVVGSNVNMSIDPGLLTIPVKIYVFGSTVA
jgi:hypothetical protein